MKFRVTVRLPIAVTSNNTSPDREIRSASDLKNVSGDVCACESTSYFTALIACCLPGWAHLPRGMIQGSMFFFDRMDCNCLYCIIVLIVLIVQL